MPGESDETIYQLTNMTLRAGRSVRVNSGVGHMWFPVIHPFPGGELIAQYSLMPDIHCFAYLCGANHSTDGGRTWSPAYSFGNFANQCLPLSNGALRRLPYYIYPDPPDQCTTFATDLSDVFPGGRSEMTPLGLKISFPRDVAVQPTGAAMMNFTGTPLHHHGRWLTTMYGCWKDELPTTRLYNLLVVESRDEGRNWDFASTISTYRDTPDPNPGTKQPPEGPCEATMALLASEQLLCIYRVGNWSNWPYRAARSNDGGRTWGEPAVLDGIGRVEPSLKLLNNGVLALSGGRPGLKLWLAEDGIGESWQSFDVLACHNRHCEAGEQMNEDGSQTTAYTELLQVSPNRLLYIYDRCPLGWNPVPLDSSERNMIFVMPIEVQRG